jgi:predicted hydrolase (HD superfamily)
MNEITRENALNLVKEHTQSESLMKHMYAVEAAMRAYATKLGEGNQGDVSTP